MKYIKDELSGDFWTKNIDNLNKDFTVEWEEQKQRVNEKMGH